MPRKSDLPSSFEPLASAVDAGPLAAAEYLTTLLAGTLLDDTQPYLSVEWVSDTHSTLLSEPQRACLRDAVVLLLETVRDAAHPLEGRAFLGNATALAAQLQILTLGTDRTEDRLWSAAHRYLERGRAEEAAVLVGLLAEHGRRQRRPEFWATTLRTFGTPSLVACVHAVMSAGSARTLAWILDNVDDRLRDELLAAVLPELVERDPAGVKAFMADAGPGSEALQWRGKLIRWLARLKLTIATAPRAPSTGPEHVTQSLNDTELSYDSYSRLAADGVTFDEAAEQWSQVDAKAQWPKLLTELMGKSDDVEH
jgi:hypothetical protein